MKFASMLLLLSTVAFAQTQTEIVNSPVDHLYVPDGFDDNDSSEVIVTGFFPNTCHSRNTVNVSMQEGNVIDIQVTAVSNKTVARNCIDMVIPYKEVVSLGSLPTGQYTVRVNQKLSEKLQIHDAINNVIDDYIYAAIDDVEKQPNGDYFLQGWRYSNCVVVDKVLVYSNEKDIISLLPVLKQVSDFCPMKGMPIQYKVKLDFSSMKTTKPLLYVRTMDGKSYNTIVDLAERR